MACPWGSIISGLGGREENNYLLYSRGLVWSLLLLLVIIKGQPQPSPSSGIVHYHSVVDGEGIGWEASDVPCPDLDGLTKSLAEAEVFRARYTMELEGRGGGEEEEEEGGGGLNEDTRMHVCPSVPPCTS